MKRSIVLVTILALLVGAAANGLAARQQPSRHPSRPAFPQPKGALDTLFFDNFEADTLGWDTMDVLVQPPYWHIDTYNAYAGHSWWCGKYDPNYTISPGYGNAWIQFLYSPQFDLSSITSDSVILSFMQYYNVEGPSGGADWDCVNLWGSTDSGNTWFVMYPDTGRGTPAYNLSNATSWHYDGMAPGSRHVPGWGGSNDGWTPAQFDLTPYKGTMLKLRFAVLSDGAASQEDGQIDGHGAWYIDSIRVDTVSAGGAADTIFYDDVENGNQGWTPGGKVPAIHWHRTAYRSNSPVTSWYCGDSLTHTQSWGYSDALVSPLIDLRQVQTTTPCTGQFSAWIDLRDGNSGYTRGWDYYDVDVSADTGKTWTTVDEYSPPMPQQTWTTSASINLTPYIGRAIKVRIAMNTDEDDTTGEGLYIDNFIVAGKGLEPLPAASSVLLVDNDANAVDLSDNSWSKYLEASLAGLGLRYSVVTIGANKPILPGYLEQYPVVEWNLGARYTPIAVNDMANILSYLDHGGNLWISGQCYLSTNPDTTVHPNLWRDYLHLSADNGWYPSTAVMVTGASGDPIGNGFADTMQYERLNGGYVYWTDAGHAYALNPDTAGTTGIIGFFKNDDSTYCALRYWNGSPTGHKIVYTAFPYEAISTSDRRDTLMARILHWLAPGQQGYTEPAQPAGLRVTQDYDSAICRWHANSEPAMAGYDIYRALQSGMPLWAKIGTVAAPETTFADTAIQPNAIYYYSILAYDNNVPRNQSGRSPWAFLHTIPWSKMGQEGMPGSGIPPAYALEQNRPNPVSDHATIRFALPSPAQVRLEVYNVAGQRVRTLADGSLPAGYHRVTWDGCSDSGAPVANGVYLYRLTAVGASGPAFTQAKRLLLVK